MKTVKLARKKALSFDVNQTLIKKFIENFTFLPQYIKIAWFCSLYHFVQYHFCSQNWTGANCNGSCIS